MSRYDFYDSLSANVAKDLLRAYDCYVIAAADAGLLTTGWVPVCVEEFYDNEYQNVWDPEKGTESFAYMYDTDAPDLSIPPYRLMTGNHVMVYLEDGRLMAIGQGMETPRPLRSRTQDIRDGDAFKHGDSIYFADGNAHQNYDEPDRPWIVYTRSGDCFFEEDIENALHHYADKFNDSIHSYDFGDGYSIEAKYANIRPDGSVGNIYDFPGEVETNHPGAEILIVYCVVAEASGLVPDRCNDWNVSIADAIRDYEEHVLPFLEYPSKEQLGVRWFALDETHCVSVWYAPDKHDGDQFQIHLELRHPDGRMGPGCEVLSDESYATNDISYSGLVSTLIDIYHDANVVLSTDLLADLADDIYATFLPDREWFIILDDIDRDCVERYEQLLGRELSGVEEYAEIDSQVDEMILEWDTAEALFAAYPELKKYVCSAAPVEPDHNPLDAQIQSASNRTLGRGDQPESTPHIPDR